MDGTDGGDPLYYNSPNDVVVDPRSGAALTSGGALSRQGPFTVL